MITTDHVQSLSMRDLSIRLKNYNINIKMEEDEDLSEMSDEDVKPEPSKYDGT